MNQKNKQVKKKLTILIFVAACISIIITCKKESEPPDLSTKITITTESADSISYRSANINGTLGESYRKTIQDYGHCWDTIHTPDTADNKSSFGSSSGNKTFTSTLQNLVPGKLYYICAYFIIDDVAVYSDEVTFNTKVTDAPVLTTTSITNITAMSATSGGNITDDGGFPVLSRGVCWSTSANPTINDSITNDGTRTGSFTSELTGLDLNTTYYVRAYAANIIGTAYGNELSFATKDGIPKLTTNEVTNIEATSATSGGNITDDGGFPITSRGVCWNTTGGPTIDDNITIDGTGTGSFTSELTGLDLNTTYYLRAYATNSIGTGYDDEISFITGFSCGVHTLYDYDGNVYSTVQIGDQCWMTENLKTTKYNDGASIPLVTDYLTWSGFTPAYCWYDNNEATYKDTYGALYNWYTVNTGNLCPSGWHVPTDAEWTTLTDYLGGESVAGGKLKETGTTHWNSPNTGATNETGFTALPGGFRNGNGGAYYYVGGDGYWWSATEIDASNAWYRILYYNSSSVVRDYASKEVGFSVRCLRD